jgi:O-antigen ligase
LAGITYRAKDDIIYRNFSNLGHIKHTINAIQKVSQKPLFGRWPWFAWPASHHRKDVPNYNPENQYLQIWIEYGVIGFVWWMYLYLRPQILWYRSYRRLQEEKLTKDQRYHSRIIIALSLGLLWLSIEWLFLHSFVDRMIVYPIMLLFGLCFGAYHKALNHEIKKREQ